MSTNKEFKDDFKCEKKTSKKNNVYEVGTKSGGAKAEVASTALSHGAPFTCAVNWPVDNTWHSTDPGSCLNNGGITSYNVGNSSNPIYDYYVQITTNQDYDYEFTDASGDTYSLNVVSVSDTHIVRFNSSGPTIIAVSGH